MVQNGEMEWSIFDETGPTEKSGPPRKVGQVFPNFPDWTKRIHARLDRNFQKICLNGSCPLSLLCIKHDI